jgi:hypothetical protein
MTSNVVGIRQVVFARFLLRFGFVVVGAVAVSLRLVLRNEGIHMN